MMKFTKFCLVLRDMGR